MVRLAGHAQKRGGACLQSSFASKVKEMIMSSSVQVLEGLLEAQTRLYNLSTGHFRRMQSSANCSSRATLCADTGNSSKWMVFSEWVTF